MIEIHEHEHIKNIPYGQSSAKCEASCHPVTLVIEAQAEGLELTLKYHYIFEFEFHAPYFSLVHGRYLLFNSALQLP